jgi:BirA family biotin operon repressor/biotin-[acetyl-CoA-carboxylase] ligase
VNPKKKFISFAIVYGSDIRKDIFPTVQKNTFMIGKVLMEFPVLNSTNDYALELLKAGPVLEGLVISASTQTQGKGQAGASWESEPGKNLAMSVILQPSFLHAAKHFYLNMSIALAVRDTLSSYTSTPFYIKWPNDIIAGNGKVAGILLQTQLKGSRFQHCVAGIGVNVNQIKFSENLPFATSLGKLAGREFNLRHLREELCFQLNVRYSQLREGNLSEISLHYANHLFKIQTPANFRRADGHIFEGVIEGVSEEGKLLIRQDKITEQFLPKEIAFQHLY